MNRTSAAVPGQQAPSPRRWTRREYERAGQLGLFGPEERLELVGGEVLQKMTPQSSRHAAAVSLAGEALRGIFPTGHHVRTQLPLALGSDSEPEPDIAVVVGCPRDYEEGHPSTAVLVVEVSETSLAFDRSTKAGLYARAGIREYWIVNLDDRLLEQQREPTAISQQPFGHHYRDITRHAESESVTPLAAATGMLSVADLLPR